MKKYTVEYTNTDTKAVHYLLDYDPHSTTDFTDRLSAAKPMTLQLANQVARQANFFAKGTVTAKVVAKA